MGRGLKDGGKVRKQGFLEGCEKVSKCLRGSRSTERRQEKKAEVVEELRDCLLECVWVDKHGTEANQKSKDFSRVERMFTRACVCPEAYSRARVRGKGC